MQQTSLGLELTMKKTRKREFLVQMERVVPWAGLVEHIAPSCPEGRSGFLLDKTNPMDGLLNKVKYLKASIRAKVEHPFRVIKRQFGHAKVRYWGLRKNTAQFTTLFALSNLMAMTGGRGWMRLLLGKGPGKGQKHRRQASKARNRRLI
jgi:hypothetical protein